VREMKDMSPGRIYQVLAYLRKTGVIVTRDDVEGDGYKKNFLKAS